MPLQIAENVARAVGAGVIDDDDLFRDWNGGHAPHQFSNPRTLVVNGDDYGKPEAVGKRIDSELPADTFSEQAAQQMDPFRRRCRQPGQETL